MLKVPSFTQPAVSSDPSEGAWSRTSKLWSSLKELCSLVGIAVEIDLEEVAFQHMQFKAGQRIFTIGQPFDMLYVVYSGFLKTVLIDEQGHEQVLAFPMKGDVLGIDGIHGKRYATEVVALTTCEVLILPFKTLTALGKSDYALEAAFHSVMCRELVREQNMVATLSALQAEARIARFLVQLSERFSALGYSASRFTLRMTRSDIGSYLGLTLETVSRTLSAMDAAGLIAVDIRTLVIKDLEALRTLRRLRPQRSGNEHASLRAQAASS